MNIGTFLERGAKRNSGAPAIVFGDRVLGYPSLIDRVGRLAAGLRELGLARGDRVLLLMPNCPELVECLWACFRGGFVAVPVNWHLHPDEVGYIVDDSVASAVVLSEATAHVAGTLGGGVRVIQVGAVGATAKVCEYESVFADHPAPVADTQADDAAWLFYTSGTTGKPKGAVLTHRNLTAMSRAYQHDLDAVPDGSVHLHAAPLTHGSGLYLVPTTDRGATHVIAPGTSFSPSGYLDLIERHHVTHATFLAPTMLNRLVAQAAARDLTSLRSIVVGGAPLYQEDLHRATAAFGPIITQMYGQGEAPMTITVMPADEALSRPGSCGRPFSTVDVRIRDVDGRPVAPGADGEVQVKGDVVMREYWHNPDATRRTLEDGWLRTGDIGHFEDGYLYLTDRAKDVIITGGSNVYPREVEEVLLRHPAVREAAVIGVPDPDWGESVRAFVVASGVTASELIEYCATRIASFKKPRSVYFVDELPKNATGKILKRELRHTSTR
ncbi:long-chain fatty acid--CoA ligase [Amycolatopsis mongoliensis]|uniref:Long-chain fatty acid--CoA ligase n=1 Tax=Amycolatopsis mongoliensis TaxID=715475 RepID=A0A9Y2JHR0_9PSEU|nr:long-chain fatty acid--CoA ligase [Amycolatopsis sp. 4-36]WIX98297.1 long-chain fatty acid--CoA ligase [Amycolatopsis sp. 4-36]